ncbi:MAG: DUF802 domain-containing protein [Acidovorax sp.]|uniref:DUF802 domain-containing protein n=1 Tax=Acidovorax sp. TaxID=1872122 RepID=UPI0039E3F214
MNKSVMVAAFAAGLAVVAWVGWGFVGTSPLALAMTVLIGAVYALGALELLRFRRATLALHTALADEAPPADLGAWLDGLPAPLRNPVRQRIEGGRAAWPGPALAPYLVGLLVMLGMLGTFLGMVVTFKGAVFALETSTSLESIRAALAEPIKGLGLSFGTSVAGVAASAMLGLLLAMARRERLAALRLLDARIPTRFRPFSARHRSDETLQALQAQAQALPLIAERLQGLMEGLERRHDALNAELLAQQQGFHREASSAYTQLASTVGASLQDSLAASARLAGDAIRPVVEQAMAALAQESQQSHERLRASTEGQMRTLSAQWEGTARQVAQTWTTALHSHAQGQEQLTAGLEGALRSVTQAFEQRSSALLTALQETVTGAQSAQAVADQQRLALWNESLDGMARAFAAQQQGLAERMGDQIARLQDGTARWLEQSDALAQARRDTEAQWAEAQAERMDALAGVWRTELAALRDDEAARGQAAVQRLDALQAAVAGHLSTLGTALEAPLTRLLQTAASVPQAAAEVITQLRQEMARMGERDYTALAERTAMMEQLGALLQSVNAATGQQREAIESMVGSANAVLEQAAQQFAQALQAQTGKADEVAAHVAASGVELASLGESFGHGVERFTAGSDRLLESLQRIEAAIGQSLARSDEQLAYYVAQAREVIDLSIASQQGIVEDLRQLHGRHGKAAALEAAA